MNPYIVMTACAVAAWFYCYLQAIRLEAQCVRQEAIMRAVAAVLGIAIDGRRSCR